MTTAALLSNTHAILENIHSNDAMLLQIFGQGLPYGVSFSPIQERSNTQPHVPWSCFLECY